MEPMIERLICVLITISLAAVRPARLAALLSHWPCGSRGPR